MLKVSAICFPLLALSVSGGGAADSEKSLGDHNGGTGVLTEIGESFRKINGLKYDCSTTVSTLIPKDELIAPRLTPERVSSISVTDLGERFNYKIDIRWWNHKKPQKEFYSFDGMQSQFFSGESDLMRISKTIRYESNFFSDFDALQTAFRPFREIAENPYTPIHLSDLKNLQDVVGILSQHDVQISQSENDKVITLKFKVADRSRSFIIHLDPEKAFFPGRWMEYNKDGKLCREYQVRKFDEAAFRAEKVALPTEAVLLEYGGHLKVPDSQPRATIAFQAGYSIVEDVNVVETDLDPIMASAIFDADSDVRIEVPK